MSFSNVFNENNRDSHKIKLLNHYMFMATQTCVCLFLHNNLLALAEKYQLIDLGLLNYEGSEATSINNNGQICGYFLKGSTVKLFIWENGKSYNYTEIRTSMDPVINNAGHVYGSRWDWVKRGLWQMDQETVFKWTNPFSYFTCLNFSDIGYPHTLFTTPYVECRSSFWDVNDLGQVLIMNHEIINRKLKYEIWLYENGKFAKVDHAQFHAAIKINNQSQLLGYFFEETFSDAKEKNKKMKAAVHHLKDGSTHLLPFPEDSMGYDINDLGEVVGLFYNIETDRVQGFFGNPTGSIIVFDNFSPFALNNNGQIIGECWDGEKSSPAIGDNGVVKYLSEVSDLIDDKGQQWHSLNALIDINDRGEIIGQGLYKGKTHGFLLVPIH